jgi:uncharacterized protein YecT (DUF1311 family)
MLRDLPLLLLSTVLFGPAHSQAVAQYMNVPGVPCNVPSTTAEEASCFHRASEAADRELNRVYTRLRSILSPEEQNDLLEAQRAWLKYRDLTCTAEYNLYRGGTGGPVTRLACLAAVTQQRVAELKTTYVWRLQK